MYRFTPHWTRPLIAVLLAFVIVLPSAGAYAPAESSVQGPGLSPENNAWHCSVQPGFTQSYDRVTGYGYVYCNGLHSGKITVYIRSNTGRTMASATRWFYNTSASVSTTRWCTGTGYSTHYIDVYVTSGGVTRWAGTGYISRSTPC